ncbi:MAG: YbaB/EbfC family nucleoid-associated protein [Patescibacteria group bacterium]
MFNKIKQIKDMRDQSKQMKAMLDEVVIVGQGMGGKVMITVNGSHETLGVKINEELDRSKIEAGVKDALNDVNSKLQVELMKKMKEMGGLDAFKNLGL